MESDQIKGATVADLMLVLGRFATVVDELGTRCEAMGEDAEALRAELRRVTEDTRREIDAKRVALERLSVLKASADRRPGDTETESYVRPYAMTRGRTAPRRYVALEALVSSANRPAPNISTMPPEHHDIFVLCRQPRSVAEVSSLLGIPLTVARIVIADMAAEALVHVYELPSEGDSLDGHLLEKVLSGLRKL